LGSLWPTTSARIALILNLPDAIERLRNLLRRQRKAIATETSCAYWLRHYVTALKAMPSSLRSPASRNGKTASSRIEIFVD
jgi:hypothetical protein